jgi:hypothetical protein
MMDSNGLEIPTQPFMNDILENSGNNQQSNDKNDGNEIRLDYHRENLSEDYDEGDEEEKKDDVEKKKD